MGRHRTDEEKRALGEKARELRANGRSRREIRRELQVGDDLLAQLLAGTTPPAGLRRLNAKDDLRAKAVELRLAGGTYDEIASELGVSKSSCSLWLRDLPRPEDDPTRRAEREQRRLEALRVRMRRETVARDAEGDLIASAARDRLVAVEPRDLLVAFAVSYWCEGTKRKPWSRRESVRWVNSDPALVRLFLEGLRLLDVGDERIACQVQIHESADGTAARRWWVEQTGLPERCFGPNVLKKHNPRTVRKNVGDTYRGCLGIRVRRSRELYLVVRGVVEGLTTLPRAPGDGTMSGSRTEARMSVLSSAVGQ